MLTMVMILIIVTMCDYSVFSIRYVRLFPLSVSISSFLSLSPPPSESTDTVTSCRRSPKLR